MTVPGNIDALLLGGQRGYQIERSLRFNSADSAYLSKTPTTPTNNLKWTFSCWVKRSALGASSALFDAYLNGVNFSTFYFTSTNELQFYNILGGVDTGVTTTGVYRDLSAWYHIVFVFDSANATAADRAIIYVNGTRPAQTNPYGAVTPSEATYLNNSYAHSIGRMVDSGTYLNGYLTETYLIDGQALTPSSFGETDTITGVWKPKKYSGSGYGTNGFYLNFKDNSSVAASTLGKDYSGNGNNWTPSATFSVTAGAGNDSLIDTPTPYADGGNGRGNYCTLNPLDSTATLSNGNLTQTATAERSSRSTFQIPSSGLWYAEATATSTTNGSTISCGFGLAAASVSLTANPYSLASAWNLYSSNAAYINRNGTASGSLGFTLTAGDVIQIAVDSANNRAWIGRNNTWYNSTTGTTGDPAGGTNPTVSSLPAGLFVFANTFNQTWDVNFGQRPFAYTPPSGFKALNTQNLPEPTIKKPSSYFDTKLYTGTSASQTISGLGFSPDLVWVKRRSNSANSHALFDAVRGAGYRLSSNETTAEVNNTANFTAFTSDGFSVASNGGETNLSPETYVAWCWDESATPGFDIVTYTGNGTARTIAHSLGVTPNFIMVKDRDSGSNGGAVYHSSLGNTKYLKLFQTTTGTDGETIDSTIWNNTSPTSSVFSVGTSSRTNANTDRYVAYLWSEVAGFSKFGSYTGNGSTDGPFVACNFRPRWVMTKRTDTTSNWMIMDAGRNPSNVADNQLYPNRSDAEAGASSSMDLTSNGFKLRNTGSDFNAATATYIFAAFAESPFKYSLAR